MQLDSAFFFNEQVHNLYEEPTNSITVHPRSTTNEYLMFNFIFRGKAKSIDGIFQRKNIHEYVSRVHE